MALWRSCYSIPCFNRLFQTKSGYFPKVFPCPILLHLYAHLRGKRVDQICGKQSVTWEKALRATAGLQTSEVQSKVNEIHQSLFICSRNRNYLVLNEQVGFSISTILEILTM
jgi:hypothetical protein